MANTGWLLAGGMYHITQTSDGFIWLLSLPGNVYRFDGNKVLPWRLPTGVPGSLDTEPANLVLQSRALQSQPFGGSPSPAIRPEAALNASSITVRSASPKVQSAAEVLLE